ncbi:MAG: oligosaccharide flippase family protein [Candidatus Manganitrophus sp. SA1]|nr:oligosaccharide flippase family protein [Candidatus Manganitrophus morganii]
MILIFLGRISQFLLLMVMVRVATMFLSPIEMGRMSLVTTTTAFFALFLVNPIGMFINRRLHAWKQIGRTRRYFDYYWGYLLLVAFVAALCLMLINRVGVVQFQTRTTWLLVLVCGSLLFNTINQTVIPSLNLFGFTGWFIGLTLLTNATGFIFALFFILKFQFKAEYWLLGLLVGQTLLAGVGYKVFFKKLYFNRPEQNFKNELTPEQIKRLFVFSWPIAISVGLNWTQTQGYRFFMEKLLGLELLGLFVAGYSISLGLITAFESVLTTYLQPRFYKQISDGVEREQSLAWNGYAGMVFPTLILTVSFIVVLAPELTRLFLGPAFQSASRFVVWGAIAEAMRVIAGVYGLVAHARMKTRLLLIPNAIGAFLSIVLVWWLVPQLAAEGVGVALTFSGVATVVVMHTLMLPHLQIALPGKLLIKSGAMAGLAMLAATLLRTIIGKTDSLEVTMVFLSVWGVLFLILQYFLLRPVLYGSGEAI